VISAPSQADILAAARRIAPYAALTPLVENFALSALAGRRVLLKLENLQRTGSFKFRGAFNRLSLIPEDRRAAGVVAFSSGNHAQGVAAAAAILGMAAVIVMPADAPRAKIDNTRALGAEVVTYDRFGEDREAIAAGICQARGATLVRPFDDAAVIAGQGTVGLEILDAARAMGVALENVLVPCSGGGLVSGIALALENSGVRAVAVEAQDFAGMGLSLKAGARQSAAGKPPSLADSLMAPIPGVLPFAIASRLMAPGIAVSDAELETAMRYSVRELKQVVEPGGAAGLAALIAGKAPGGPIAVVLSGGNCDLEVLARICGRP
jgi:threonine dehydratase